MIIIFILLFFQFGGHLVSFGSKGRSVAINQVVTEPHLLKQSNDFESAVQNQQFVEHCSMKVGGAKTEKEQKIWNFLKVSRINISCTCMYM